MATTINGTGVSMWMVELGGTGATRAAQILLLKWPMPVTCHFCFAPQPPIFFNTKSEGGRGEIKILLARYDVPFSGNLCERLRSSTSFAPSVGDRR